MEIGFQLDIRMRLKNKYWRYFISLFRTSFLRIVPSVSIIGFIFIGSFSATNLLFSKTDNVLKSVKLIGDANAPGLIAWAIYAGHRYARELDEPELGDNLPFQREITELAIY